MDNSAILQNLLIALMLIFIMICGSASARSGQRIESKGRVRWGLFLIAFAVIGMVMVIINLLGLFLKATLPF